MENKNSDEEKDTTPKANVSAPAFLVVFGGAFIVLVVVLGIVIFVIRYLVDMIFPG